MNKIYQGDALEVLRTFPDTSINCCVTSPPYWGLRDYGVDGQIGLEKTPEEYTQKMVDLFREVRRVLRDDGTLWLNLGDSYYNFRGYTDYATKQTCASNEAHVMSCPSGKRNVIQEGLKGKDLVGIPWMVAFALRADGWYLRQDIIWHKPNPMPESVTDRCTKAHEFIFLLAKSQKYYYDAEAIKEKSLSDNSGGCVGNKKYSEVGFNPQSGNEYVSDGFRNRRSVWTVTTKPFKGAHFATFPPDLIEPCILAGCPKGGLVLDPFMGAGTTAVVAKSLGRNYVGCELNQKYIEIAEQRLMNTMGSLL